MSSGILRSVGRWLGLAGNKTTISNARALFFNCKTQADLPQWITKGRVNADFRSKHALLVLHVWMVHKRLLKEGKRGLLVQEALFDELWEDTSNRIRGQGINELSVNKHLKEVQGISFRMCVELDHSLSLLSDPTKALAEAAATAAAQEAANKMPHNPRITVSEPVDAVSETSGTSKGTVGVNDVVDDEQLSPAELRRMAEDEVGGVLWRSLYMRRDEVDVPHVLKLARYVLDEQQSLLELPADAIFEGRISWGPIPDWPKLHSAGAGGGAKAKARRSGGRNDGSRDGGEETGGASFSGANIEVGGEGRATAGEWKEAVAADGRTYYWNTATRESRWEKP